jgi:flagellar basal body-associated protein FliL
LKNEEKNSKRKSKKFSWIPFVIGVGVALSLIVLIGIILLLIVKHKKQAHCKAVRVYV